MQDITDILSKYGVSISKFSSSEVITPTNIVQDMINLLPEEVFTPDAKFLDPAAKSGRFLYYLKDKLMHAPSLITAFPSKSAREQHILTHQLYGITTSEASLSFVRANLYGSWQVEGNIRYIENFSKIIGNKNTDIKSLLAKEFNGTMNFDVVIGNPPYNESAAPDGAL